MPSDGALRDAILLAPDLRHLFSDEHTLSSMLAFEAALAQAEARVGMVPRAAAEIIVECCRVESIDREKLAEKAVDAGNLAIPLVQLLTAVAKARDESA